LTDFNLQATLELHPPESALWLRRADTPSREKLFLSLVGQEFSLSPADIRQLAKATDGYSNSDITHVCRSPLPLACHSARFIQEDSAQLCLFLN